MPKTVGTTVGCVSEAPTEERIRFISIYECYPSALAEGFLYFLPLYRQNLKGGNEHGKS